MPRISRIVVPGVAHHITQRGARRMQVFFGAADYALFLGLLRDATERFETEVWAYCLMPNHVHLLLAPHSVRSLSAVCRSVHQAYAERVNRRFGWKGHLWQERFCSFPMDEAHVLRAARYVLLNPVRAGLVARAWDWPASSARAHLGLCSDPVVCRAALQRRITDWSDFLAGETSDDDVDALRRAARTGRPLGAVRPCEEEASA